MRTRIDVKVVGKFKDGYGIRWTYGKTDLLGGAVGREPLIDELSNLAENMRTDAYGSVAGLDNIDEVISYCRLAVDRYLHATSSERPADTARLRSVLVRFRRPEVVEAFALKDLGFFYIPSGGAYPLGKPLTYKDSLPNPLDGRPFPSKAQFLLREVDPVRNRAVIEWRQNIDPRQAAAILGDGMTAIAERMGQQLPETMKWPQIRIEDVASYQFDTVTGWPLSVEHTRTSIVGPRRRIDRLTIRVVFGR